MGRPMTKRSKNLSKSDYVYAEKHFEFITKTKRVFYWPPLKYEQLETIRYRLNKSDFPSEKWFQNQLIQRKIKGFLRNWPIANRFFADFYFPRANLIVEIDGKEHTKDQDKKRDRIFRLCGFSVLRIPHLDHVKLREVIRKIENNSRCVSGFKLQRKKVSENDMYKYFPPEAKAVVSTPEIFKPRVMRVIVRKFGSEEEREITIPSKQI